MYLLMTKYPSASVTYLLTCSNRSKFSGLARQACFEIVGSYLKELLGLPFLDIGKALSYLMINLM